MDAHASRKAFSSDRKVALLLVLVLVWAFVLRFIFFYQIARSPIADMLSLDSEYYNNWAREIAKGHWIGNKVFYALPASGVLPLFTLSSVSLSGR